MSKEQRGIRDGTGPYKESFRKTIEKKEVGRRIEAGEKCPEGNTKFTKEEQVKKISFWGKK